MHHAGAGALGGRCGEVRGACHPVATGNDSGRRPPLVGIGAARPPPPLHIQLLDEMGSGTVARQPDLGDLDRPRQL